MISLPFHSDANTGLGILIKTYLEDAVQKPVTDKKAAAEEALKHAEETFTGCPDVKAEVLRAFRFWDQVRRDRWAAATNRQTTYELIFLPVDDGHPHSQDRECPARACLPTVQQY